MVKIAYFQNECAPYRIPVFQGISKLPSVDLKVYFGRYRSSDRQWNVRLDYGFRYEILREIQLISRLFYFGLVDDANPFNPLLLFKLLTDENYDIFVGGVPHYLGTMITYLVSRLKRKAFVVFLEDIDGGSTTMTSYLGRTKKNPLKALNYPLILLRFFFGQFVLRHADCCVVPGSGAKQYALRRGVAPHKIFIAWNVVDNDAIKQKCEESIKKGTPERLRNSLSLENKKMVLSVANLRKEKGLEYLIEACAKLKKERDDLALVIAGEGSLKEDLKRLSNQNKLETVFVGFTSDVVDYYLAADAFVLPTLLDVWGFVINEAMVCGCPIVTTYDCGAGKDLVRNGVNGFLVEAKSSEKIYRALRTIINDDRLRQEMKSASRKIISNFSYQTSLHGYVEVIKYLENKNNN